MNQVSKYAIPFGEVNIRAIESQPALMARWYPADRIDGKENCIGSNLGEQGRGIKVNLLSGVWANLPLFLADTLKQPVSIKTFAIVTSRADDVSNSVSDRTVTSLERGGTLDVPPDVAGTGALLAGELPVDVPVITKGVVDDNTILASLAAMPMLEYERAREEAAKELGISRLSILDLMVKALRKKQGSSDSGVMFPKVTPWPHPVDAARVLDAIRVTIRRYIVCSPEIATATSLWVAFTWLIDHVQIAPILNITAPEKQCGKSQLLTIAGYLCYRPLVASNISPAAVFRVIDAHSPTLLLDEADSFFKDNEELRGIINSGHTRQMAFVIRTVGDDHEPKRFSTWGAKAIAGIGRIPETLIDRSIVLELRRKLPHETAERLRHARPGHFNDLCRQLARFSQDSGEAIGRAHPTLPDELGSRAQDNWEPLLAIADYVGGHWPQTARSTALKLSRGGQDAVSLSAELLTDIRDIFDTKKVARFKTVDLLAALFEDDERPWATMNRGKEMTPRQLAKRLEEYGIKSKNLKTGQSAVSKGFERAQFDDVFDRYLSSATPENIRYSATNQQEPNETVPFTVAAEVAATDPHPLPLPPNPLSTLIAQNPDCPLYLAANGSGIAANPSGSGNEILSATGNPAENKGSSGVAAKAGDGGEYTQNTNWGGESHERR